jgi:hypothetical protein
LTRKVKISVPLLHHFVKFKYVRLPMRLKCSPDIAQAIMENALSDIKDADVYIDDIGDFSCD